MSPLIIDDHSPSVSPTRRARSSSFAVTMAKPRDCPRLVDIEFCAFANERTNHLLSYRDPHQKADSERAVRCYRSLLRRNNRRAGSSIVSFRKVTDTTTGKIISFAKTEFKAYTEEELASRPDTGHEGESRMNRDWFALNEKWRRAYVGTRRHCYLGMVATQPAYQQRGAATMILEPILGDADAEGVECYLEATSTAKPLYERHGFVAVGELSFDPAAYGVFGYKVETQTVMVRGALDSRGVRQEVTPWNVETGPVQAMLS
ncbi:unnamed protein product [Zymoseptoria tritici ST99CH_3D7]|uniref:N-acetyltransferase domain-containing protein n=4 Tax=Zymoseptoria tritici TaxID=1047171 RepID=F9XBM6_ZYMTI|nr:uncharacterized protein MYCGRDRAFT_93128 [Zymoseptoria tritici IPO323]EGP87112.1 hypothetical protein MYCGRDRAFT_93128 [Zymoseptoria tritici IPO323]SMQ50712.1 unnamed protein product [Zymoseptoria tritici ST99CH_3D7]